jgi:hypothetical protein
VPIYSLAFGEEANIYFLRRLSAENFGSARRIYDADDAAIQLHEVYAELASPVQADCIFKYPETMASKLYSTYFIFIQNCKNYATKNNEMAQLNFN